MLRNEGLESHVVDPSIRPRLPHHVATGAKTDRIDGEALVRALLAYKRGEPRVCAMVKAPTSDEEDRHRLCRERKVLIAERVRHGNRVSCAATGGSGWIRSRPAMVACCRMKAAEAALDAFIETYGVKYEKAVECLTKEPRLVDK